MQKIDLYRYDINGRVMISPTPKNILDISTRTRLVADQGFILTNGSIYATVIDIKSEDISSWKEININPDLEKLL